MKIHLTAEEARVIGCLMEKAVTTPDQYPLTLNALTNACNQKSSREPVMDMTPGAVQRVARLLEERFLVKCHENFKSGVAKYEQRFCNTTLSDYPLSAPEYAIVCLLLLRGPQTAGEIRARSPRLHEFIDNEAVNEVFEALMSRETGPIIARLPRQSGRKDHQYMHLLSGDIESVAADAERSARPVSTSRGDQRVVQLEARVARLEAALTGLAERLGETLDLGDADSD